MPAAADNLRRGYRETIVPARRRVQWNTETQREPLMHRIHGYPAKFPSFIASRALAYARSLGINVRCMADIFCGCGTTALEARREGVHFWGCDINPVATLIARVKSHDYQLGRLTRYQSIVSRRFASSAASIHGPYPERLQYWFRDEQLNDLSRLLTAIRELPPGKYREFFLCAFSNILKPVSRWLTKSIKPQVDPAKISPRVIDSFVAQCSRMVKAVTEERQNKTAKRRRQRTCRIVTGNFLDIRFKKPVADLLVTSPPYVTSYEYADLHQLSALWLGYTGDYRNLRKGSIGSLHHESNFDRDLQQLSGKEKSAVSRLHQFDSTKGKAAARYFLDIKRVLKKTFSLLRKDGMLLLIVGNTAYGGVELNNAAHIRRCLRTCGYHGITRTRRRISFKTLTPYRDKRGRFTRDSSGRQVYAEEFVFTARK
jgi:hypothetical protein